MDDWASGACGGDGTRDFFGSPDPMSSPHPMVANAGSLPGSSRFSGSRLDFDGLDLNTESDGFPHLGTYQGYLQAGDDVGPAAALGTGADAAIAGSGPPAWQPSRSSGGGVSAMRAIRPGRGGGLGPRRGGRRAGAGRTSAGRAPAGPSRPASSARRKAILVDDDSPPANDVAHSAPANDFARSSRKEQMHRANWADERNTHHLCEIILEQKQLGNYVMGQMYNRGYSLVAKEFFRRTQLRHDTGQFRNKLRQLKNMFHIIKKIRSNTGLGRRPDGWPDAPASWWDEFTKNLSPELKKLRNGPPSYINLLYDIFEGVTVDGSTAIAAGQADVDADEDVHADEGEDNDDDDADDELQGYATPTTSGSLKRASSNSSTGRSPTKRSRSPMVSIFRNLLALNTRDKEKKWQHMEERRKKEQHESEERRKKEQDEAQERMSTVDQVQQLALEAGVERGSAEYLAVGVLATDDVMRHLFFACHTPDQRLQFIRRYMTLKRRNNDDTMEDASWETLLQELEAEEEEDFNDMLPFLLYGLLQELEAEEEEDFNDMLPFLLYGMQYHSQHFDRAQVRRKKEQDEAQERMSTVDQVQQLTLEAGVERGSAEHLAVGVLATDDVMRHLFFACHTPDQRIQFIRRYMSLKCRNNDDTMEDASWETLLQELEAEEEEDFNDMLPFLLYGLLQELEAEEEEDFNDMLPFLLYGMHYHSQHFDRAQVRTPRILHRGDRQSPDRFWVVRHLLRAPHRSHREGRRRGRGAAGHPRACGVCHR